MNWELITTVVRVISVGLILLISGILIHAAIDGFRQVWNNPMMVAARAELRRQRAWRRLERERKGQREDLTRWR